MRYIFTLLFLFTALSAVEYKPLVLGADGKTRQFPDGEQLRTVPTYGLDASKPAAATANTGMIYCATDSQKIYRSNGSSWILFSVGQIGSSNIGAAPNAQGLTITGTSINLQPASASFGGVVTTGTQTFAGDKTFTGAITASNLSGTNTGDLVNGLSGSLTGGRVPYANGTATLTDSATLVFSASTGLNVALGTYSATNLTIGNGAGDTLGVSINNTLVGSQAGTAITTSGGNTGLGSNALLLNTAANNTAVGFGAADAVTTNTGVTAVGMSALGAATGEDNTALGMNAGLGVTTGRYNTAIGRNANNTGIGSGDGNTVIGAYAAAVGGATNNTVVGRSSSTATAGNNCIFLGAGAASTNGNDGQFNLGGDSLPIREVWIGEGFENASALSVAVGNTRSTGTNVAGQNLTIRAGAGTGTGGGGKLIFQTSPVAQVDRLTVSNAGNIEINTLGAGLQVKEGSNAKMGTSTLVAGTVTVSTTAVTATSRIFLTSQADGGTVGFQRVSARTAATSFTITSSSGTDTSTIAWFIVEPSP